MIVDELATKPCYSPNSYKRLIDCLAIPTEYESVFEKMVGRWLVCETETEAIHLQRTRKGWNCVTLQGTQYFAKGEVRRERKNEFGFKTKGDRTVTAVQRRESKALLVEKEREMAAIAKELEKLDMLQKHQERKQSMY